MGPYYKKYVNNRNWKLATDLLYVFYVDFLRHFDAEFTALAASLYPSFVDPRLSFSRQRFT